ncbi:hypothetical protein B5807_11392 [Epicoccum nigrum]|uniref:Uncharacterized protein n=1 Tax=Epicoccum nigrum TaxID=105696 RepID=A0A1Y2LK54_EPING|nr:hypothetical protein B5807_11392 [Epicoccum nigrum]
MSEAHGQQEDNSTGYRVPAAVWGSLTDAQKMAAAGEEATRVGLGLAGWQTGGDGAVAADRAGRTGRTRRQKKRRAKAAVTTQTRDEGEGIWSLLWRTLVERLFGWMWRRF